MKKKNFIAIISSIAMASTLFPGTLITKNTVDIVSAATVGTEKEDRINFNDAKNSTDPQTFTHDAGGNFNIWATTLSVDPRTKIKKVAIYGKFDLPLSSSDIDIEELDEYPNKLFLPRDNNYIDINGGLKSYILWSDEDPNSKYDKQIFVNDGYLYIRGESAKLVIKDQEFEIKISDKPNKTVTNFLEEAITEHWGEYSAVKYSGLKLTQDSEEAYLKKNEEAKALTERAKTDTSITQDQIDNMINSLNQTFGNLSPMPYEKTGLKEAISRADNLLSKNGKNGKRFTKASFDDLMTAYNYAQELLSLSDLNSIVTPIEGEPIKTHKDFETALTSLNDKINNLTEEEYSPIDLKKLWDAYYEAINLRPDYGYGYTDDSRNAFYDKLDEIRHKQFYDDIYMNDDDVNIYIAQIQNAKNNLQKIKLDENTKVSISIKYTKPLEDSVSSLIKEYFRDGNNEIININKEVIKDSEVYLPLSDKDVIKEFEGYTPKSFHYNSDDGSLRLVRYFKDANDNRFVVFKATSKNKANKATLDIYYEKSDEKNNEKNNEIKPPVSKEDKIDKVSPTDSLSDKTLTNKNDFDSNKSNSSSGSGGSSHAGQTYFGKKDTLSNTNQTPIATSKLDGGWELNNNTWKYKQANGKYLSNSWGYLEKNNSKIWYLFDSSSKMVTGWHKSSNGKWYYFNPQKGNNEGIMLKGWQWIESADKKERCYYMGEDNTTEGILYTNTIISGKYTVNENGAWTVNGIEQIKIK